MGAVEKWIALTYVPNLGPRRIAVVYRELGSIDSFYAGNRSLLSQVLNLNTDIIDSMLRAVDLRRGITEAEACRRKGINIVCPQSSGYPRLLLECHDPPPVLYYVGELPRQDMLGVVGSRKATRYGRMATGQLIPPLCQAGLGIVSGLAIGIDAYAHKACLAASGYTLAVLGNGVDIFYPYDNNQLQKEILARGGCLVSEFSPGTRPRPDHFPRRNRIISGLCRGVLVIEAGLKSGAMITVGFALEQGRDVFSVPGNIDSLQSAGANNLIQLGAKPVLSAKDILEEYNLDLPLQANRQSPALDSEDKAILALIDQQGVGLDELCYQLDLAGGVVLARLSALELKGLIERLPGQKYIRTSSGGATL